VKIKLLIAVSGAIALSSVAALALAGAASIASTVKVYVACSPPNSKVAFPAYVPEMHPGRCDIFGIPADSADEIQLEDGHWTDWAQPTTSATGRMLPENPGMTGPGTSPIKFKLTRIEKGCKGKYFYTRALFSDHESERISDACKL
jgi:hypothetical protein